MTNAQQISQSTKYKTSRQLNTSQRQSWTDKYTSVCFLFFSFSYIEKIKKNWIAKQKSQRLDEFKLLKRIDI